MWSLHEKESQGHKRVMECRDRDETPRESTIRDHILRDNRKRREPLTDQETHRDTASRKTSWGGDIHTRIKYLPFRMHDNEDVSDATLAGGQDRTYWTRKLHTTEQKDPARWGHDLYAKQNPDEFLEPAKHVVSTHGKSHRRADATVGFTERPSPSSLREVSIASEDSDSDSSTGHCKKKRSKRKKSKKSRSVGSAGRELSHTKEKHKKSKKSKKSKKRTTER